MPTYHAPLRDMRFVFQEVLDVEAVSRLPGYEEATPDIFDAVLEEAAKLCENVLMPLNMSGDSEGCHFENGEVRTPAGFKEAYRAFCDGGWVGLSLDPAHGGQGLPEVLGVAVGEMICSTNLSFGTYPALSQGAFRTIAAHGSEELKERYLAPLASGAWSGTMCLTEPQCGTDLGLIRTKAVPAENGGFLIDGTKIFITAGEHDLAENIVHLVLARLPDAPPGVKGISLFLVPKLLPDVQGRPGPRNGVACGSIEQKMGIKASATCVMHFEDARGWLVGEPHRGLRCMFTMMNLERLAVGMQGLGLAETAYQSAAAYAKERLQGRSVKGPRYPERAADPIIVHPDVRRMLLTIRAQAEAARALCYWVGINLDVSERHADAAVRTEAEDLVALMTPIVKAHLTDFGFEATNLALQVYGGHGYIRENGIEQLVRDARIAQVYEGANGIQALDLVGRKMPMHSGRLLRRFFHPVAAFCADNEGDPVMAEFVKPLSRALGALQKASLWIAAEGLRDAEEGASAASEYLRLFGLVASGYMWARMVKAAAAHLDSDDDADGFYRAKLETARFYMRRILPQAGALVFSLTAGAKSLMALPDEAF